MLSFSTLQSAHSFLGLVFPYESWQGFWAVSSWNILMIFTHIGKCLNREYYIILYIIIYIILHKSLIYWVILVRSPVDLTILSLVAQRVTHHIFWVNRWICKFLDTTLNRYMFCV
jgi:hypothetical protein